MTTKRVKKTALQPQAEHGAVTTKPLSGEHERLVEVFREGARRSLRLPRFKGTSLDDTNQNLGAMMEICKTDHINAAIKIIQDVTAVRPSGTPEQCLNMALQQIETIKPQSYLESMLVCQMLQVNEAITKCMGSAFHQDQHMAGKEMNLNFATKLQRTFVAQIDALQKLQGKGGQKVTVEHVNVHEGGQAIVGNVTSGGDGNER